MGSRSASDGHELARIDEFRELAVRLLRLQVQKLFNIASLDRPTLLVRKLHYEFRVPDFVDVGLAHEIGILAGSRVHPAAEHVGAAAGVPHPFDEARLDKVLDG